MSANAHVAVVGSLGYKERLGSVPREFEATLVPEPENRYFLCAIAVHAPAGKIGYVAPEAARGRYDTIKTQSAAGPVKCPARRATSADRTSQGAIEYFIDLSSIPAAE